MYAKLGLMRNLIIGVLLIGCHQLSFGAPEDWMDQISTQEFNAWDSSDGLANEIKDNYYAE